MNLHESKVNLQFLKIKLFYILTALYHKLGVVFLPKYIDLRMLLNLYNTFIIRTF